MSRYLAVTTTLIVLTVASTARAIDRPQCDDAQKAVQAQLDAGCPCTTASSHAAHVRCVNEKLRALSACRKDANGKQICGPVPRACVASLRRVAMRSGCGNADAVSCCIARQHDCVNDPTPGDGKKDGKCSGGQQPCDSMADCRIPTCRQASSAARCEAVGGTVGTGKDCSTACAP